LELSNEEFETYIDALFSLLGLILQKPNGDKIEFPSILERALSGLIKARK
jgi:hypothetical protein